MPPSCSSGRFYSPTLGMLFALLFIICAFTYAAIDIQSISQPATVSFRSIGTGLETLGLDGKQQPLQLELKTTQRAFLLDLERPKNLLSPDYEEVTHDITRGTVRNPHINVIRRGTNHHEVSNLNNCLYSGKIAGDPLSSVSLSTCSGHITGMIRLSTGELFSIEPTVDRNIASNSKTAPNPKTLTPSSYLQPLAALRTLARNGDLKTLADNIPTVNIVDVLAEARLEDEEEKEQKNVYPFNIKKRASTKADPLNVEDIDQGDVVSTTTKKCASDVQKNHPPLSVLRKIGFNSKDLRQFVRDHGLKSTTLSTLSGEDDTKDDTTQAEAKALAYPTRYLEVVIYHDKARLNSYKKAGLSEDDIMAQARDDSIEVFNNIRAYYQGAGFQHAIEYILKGHVFFPKGDPYIKYLAGDGGTMVINNYGLLENFNKYRNLYGHSGHDIGILLSGNRFQSNIKGVANVGSLCGGARYNGNINSVTYRNIVLNSVLTAHECGHVMNAQHDSNPGYIMNPYVSSDTSFSPNSKRSIDWMLSRTTCTINNPQTSTALGGDVDDRDTNTTTYGVLSDTVNKLSGGRLGAPSSQRSSIYTSNIHNDDQIDFVNESLLTGGVFNSAEYSLSDDSNILINRQLRDITQQSSSTTATTTPIAPDTHVGGKGGFSLRDLLLTLGLSALAACALTTIAILGALRYVSHDKQLQHYISKPIEKLIPLHHTTAAAKDSKHTTKTDKKTSSIHHHTTPPTATRPISYQNAVTQNIPTNTTTTESSRYTFVPRTTNKPSSAAAVGGLGLDTAVNTNTNGLSPNTPREVPASPTYSESVRHRAHSAQTTDQTGIIFEGDHDGHNDGDESDEDLRSLH